MSLPTKKSSNFGFTMEQKTLNSEEKTKVYENLVWLHPVGESTQIMLIVIYTKVFSSPIVFLPKA